MRQASWIAFLLLAVGLLTYDTVRDDRMSLQSSDETQVTVDAPEGGMPFPKP